MRVLTDIGDLVLLVHLTETSMFAATRYRFDYFVTMAQAR